MTDLAERSAPAPAVSAPLPRVERPRVDRAWSLRRSLTVLALVASLISVAMIAAGAVALVNQETGIRGYALAGQEVFLQPWETGQRDEAAAVRALSAVADDPVLGT